MSEARMTERVAFEGALAAKLAAGTLVAGVAIVLIGRAPWSNAPDATEPEPTPRQETVSLERPGEAETSDPFELEPTLLGESMAMFPNAPRAPEPVDEPTGDEPDAPIDEPGPATASGDQVAFLGAIIGPRTSYAIVQVGEDQVWIPEGGTRRGIEVLEVTAMGARVRYEDGREADLEQGERSGSALTVIPSNAGGGSGAIAPGSIPGGVNRGGQAAEQPNQRVMDLQERRARRLEQLEEQRRRLAEQRGEGGE